MMKSLVTFHAPNHKPEERLIYVIIGARYLNNWIFVFHNIRKGYGLPAGHIEENEQALEAAKRELREETGAIEFKIDCIATYSVESGERKGSGRLYFAEVSSLGEIIDSDEIGSILLSQDMPGDLLYSDVQKALFKKLTDYYDQV